MVSANAMWTREYRRLNKAKVNAYNTKWRRANPEKAAEMKRKWREANRETVKAKAKAWRARHKEKLWADRIWAEYGLTMEALNRMNAAHGNACAICRTVFVEGSHQPASRHIDHDHATGEVRGLLCSCCNWGLGHFKDDPSRLQAAAAYLKKAP